MPPRDRRWHGGKGISVAIVGGGIGGLSAALSLLRMGIDAHVYEQAGALAEVGAGVQISPNASRVLHRLGLGDALSLCGVEAVALHQRHWRDGRTLLRTPLADVMEATFKAPHYQLHRADLLEVLAQALRYRGLVRAERLAHLELEPTLQVWMGPGKHFVNYFVRRRERLNFVAIIEQDAWTRESWTDRGEIADALAAFEGWHPQVREIIRAVDETFIWALFDRTPIARWSVGRVTLLGDACHAMLPFMGQGAAQAIEDGATLSADA